MSNSGAKRLSKFRFITFLKDMRDAASWGVGNLSLEKVWV
jgi:hypothetical protein